MRGSIQDHLQRVTLRRERRHAGGWRGGEGCGLDAWRDRHRHCGRWRDKWPHRQCRAWRTRWDNWPCGHLGSRGHRLERRHERRHVGPREPLRQQQRQLRRGLAGCGGDQHLGVRGRQVRRQHQHRAQVQPPLGDRREERRALPGRAGDADALERRVLGHAQRPDAPGVHGRVRRRQVEPALVDLGQQREQRRGGGPAAGPDGVQLVDQRVIGETEVRVRRHAKHHRGGDDSRGRASHT